MNVCIDAAPGARRARAAGWQWPAPCRKLKRGAVDLSLQAPLGRSTLMRHLGRGGSGRQAGHGRRREGAGDGAAAALGRRAAAVRRIAARHLRRRRVRLRAALRCAKQKLCNHVVPCAGTEALLRVFARQHLCRLEATPVPACIIYQSKVWLLSPTFWQTSFSNDRIGCVIPCSIVQSPFCLHLHIHMLPTRQ